MRPSSFSAFCLALFLALAPVASIPVLAASGTPAEIASQTRDNWDKARVAYLASVKPYENQALVAQYTLALDKAGASLERYLELKLATPATPPAKLTPAVDRLVKDLTALRKLRGKAKGPLANVLGTALAQHNQIAQTALKNMH